MNNPPAFSFDFKTRANHLPGYISINSQQIYYNHRGVIILNKFPKWIVRSLDISNPTLNSFKETFMYFKYGQVKTICYFKRGL